MPRDDPAIIGSGPTVIEDVSPDEVLSIIHRYGVHLPPGPHDVLTWSRSNTGLQTGPIQVIANSRMALLAAAEKAVAFGLQPLILGEAREMGISHAGIAHSARRYGVPVSAPAALLSGSETTITVHCDGRGGRNAEFLLAFAIVIAMEDASCATIASDTDGSDGSGDKQAPGSPKTCLCVTKGPATRISIPE